MEFTVPMPDFWANDLKRIDEVARGARKGRARVPFSIGTQVR